MEKVSANLHLTRRNGVYYYRRRVPDFAIAALGRKVIQYSLKTQDRTRARKQCEIEDVKWSAYFEDIARSNSSNSKPKAPIEGFNAAELVREYVERTDERSRKRLQQEPPLDREELEELKIDAEMNIGALRNPADPNSEQWVSSVAVKLLSKTGITNGTDETETDIEQLVRRGLLELGRRQLARLGDDYSRSHFDALFDPARARQTTFQELAEQYLQEACEDAVVNGLSRKRTDKVRANVALIREVVGDQTPASAIDYDACLRVRSILARTPTNRTKLYPKLNLEEAIEKAKIDGKSALSATTQSQYLETLKGILQLAFLKRLIPHNPAQSLRPSKRDDTSPRDKRHSFSLEQIKVFFTSAFYRSCAPGAEHPYTGKDRTWRFWLPLLCLFMGLRPNEACQMLIGDVKQTPMGVWYVDVAATGDEDDSPTSNNTLVKTIKTAASRRRLPVHPELIAMGFLELAKGPSASRLFATLKPDKYGNLATYALRRFREVFLPEAMTVEDRQSFYSFRHSFRDALRRSDAQPATLQALGGWNQGSLTSDSYGDQFDPDYQAQAMNKVAFPSLDLSYLHAKV